MDARLLCFTLVIATAAACASESWDYDSATGCCHYFVTEKGGEGWTECPAELGYPTTRCSDTDTDLPRW
jgi:hypothetical protein